MRLESKYYNQYYALILDGKSSGDISLDKVFKIIYDLTDRGGIKHAFQDIDAEIQDEIIEKWKTILNGD